tara:strand:+ start:31 stop:156 length:126 start_codon:yes stop_codon:yes gene_type:complete
MKNETERLKLRQEYRNEVNPVIADWSYLRCGCGKRIKPSEG